MAQFGELQRLEELISDMRGEIAVLHETVNGLVVLLRPFYQPQIIYPADPSRDPYPGQVIYTSGTQLETHENTSPQLDLEIEREVRQQPLRAFSGTESRRPSAGEPPQAQTPGSQAGRPYEGPELPPTP